MKRIVYFACLSLFVSACATTATDNTQRIDFSFSGEMLFEGSNTLQSPATLQPKELAEKLGISEEQIKSISVQKAQLSMDPSDAEVTESLLLQIVSNNESLKTIGTLSPLTEPEALNLSLSEESNLLPYLHDEGATWVLDLNLSTEAMDELTVQAGIQLLVTYQE